MTFASLRRVGPSGKVIRLAKATIVVATTFLITISHSEPLQFELSVGNARGAD